jgi:transcriptional regulator with XRE-family HTH domain
MKKAKRKNSPRSASAIDKYIGARMREQRLVLKMSQGQLGRELGVSFQQIQKYESGVNRVSAARLYSICKAVIHVRARPDEVNRSGPPRSSV